MSATTWTYLPDVLEEHLEEIGFLWNIRRTALRSPGHTMRSVLELDERIEAHVQGVLTAGADGLERIEQGLSGKDELEVFAAAFALLHWGNEQLAGRVIDTFVAAEGPRLNALATALAHAPQSAALTRLLRLVDSPSAVVGVAAAHVLARHKAFELSTARLNAFLLHEDPLVRRGGWELVALTRPALEAKLYAAGLRDADASVKAAALQAAAWAGQPGVLVVCRQLAQSPAPESVEALQLLAVLGAPEDARLFAAIADAQQLGPARLRLLGAFGHPGFMELILAELSNPDPLIACAAGEAFEKMTGSAVESGTLTTAPPAAGQPADPFEQEFAPQLMLPDPALARKHWDAMRPQVGAAVRVCRGSDMAQPLTPQAFEAFDMESRWETCLRSRFYGAWDGSPLFLEMFPQRG